MPDSKAPYIIICSGRIDVLAASGTKAAQTIKAASDAARNLVVYYGDKLSAADTTPISDLQHYMMEHFNRSGLDKVDEMFELLDALEEKYGG